MRSRAPSSQWSRKLHYAAFGSLRTASKNIAIQGSRLRLEQALVNLLANAVKFNREGGEVRIEARRNGNSEVHVAISDTGIGIPSTDLPRIFERFYRVDKARSRQVGGTGLGLSIVKHILDGMNGRVAVESQLGRGSRFTIILREDVFSSTVEAHAATTEDADGHTHRA